MKKIIALILVFVFAFSTMSITAYAEESKENTVTVNEVEFVFDADTTEDFRSKFIAHYFSHGDEDAATYGLICTLFGHKIESTVSSVITHKVKSTDPRCLQERYNVETCSRCDYINKTLLSSYYISCC